MLNTQCTRRKATLYFLPAIAVKVESLVTDIVTDVLIRFPIVAQHSNGAHYFCRVVGLVVINIHYPQRTFSRIFCNNFINCLPILKILSLLDTVINYLQNRYNTSLITAALTTREMTFWNFTQCSSVCRLFRSRAFFTWISVKWYPASLFETLYTVS